MIIKVRVIPTTTSNEVVSRIGSVLRVKVKTKSIETEANDIIQQFLADFFAVNDLDVNIIKGAKGKEKTVEIRGKSEESLKKVMDAIP
ncbi:hypothetical protein Dip510_001530 [Elusimicrobium posterum]|uniref:DUF167 domain-containing protein n=1 Tax=Elusimicrobium posterum TaxID=3116653 RepID=UPI003C7593E3